MYNEYPYNRNVDMNTHTTFTLLHSCYYDCYYDYSLRAHHNVMAYKIDGI